MKSAVVSIVSALSLAPLVACSKDEPAQQVGSQIAVNVAPLALPGVGNAFYTIRVYAADPRLGAAPLVAEIGGVDADRYGDKQAAITYVAPCDASAPTNFVEVTLDELRDTDDGIIDASTWQNPTPLVRPAACEANRDTAVTFNITILRDAKQGFFDVAVNFSDIFCSAKFDCRDDEDQPLELLFDPATQQRDTTMVLAFACTAGLNKTTFLHMSDVYVECDPDGPGGNPPATYWTQPTGLQGNHGAVSPVFFETGLYMGEEQLPNYDKCYWNMAFGLGQNAPGNCKLIVDATASDTSWTTRNGQTPEDSVYPYVHYEIPFTTTEGGLACGKHAVNNGDTRVTTKYTSFSGTAFPFEWKCGDEAPVENGRVACDGTVPALGNAGAAFTQTPGGVSATFGASRTRSYQLRDNLTIGDCCLNPCCSAP